jgi:uncharacterized glyoxalase superfamily protein PhnB
MSWTARSAAPVLVVDAVEPSLAFWEDRLGFTRITDVPHGEVLGFALLVKDSIEVMLQSEASVRDDMGGALTGRIAGMSTAYYVRVSDLDAVIAALGDYPIALPRRMTFYGADEIGVYEPGGHLVVFAKPPAAG